MRLFRLFMLLLILRPCPACLASEVAAEIAPPEADHAHSAELAHDDCECPHGHDHNSQKAPDQPKCPCCSPDYWPAKLNPSVSPPRDAAAAGMLPAACDIDVTHPTIARIAKTTREALPDREGTSLPLLI